MRLLQTTALVGLVALLDVAACSSSATHRKPGSPEDSGAPDAGAGGSGGSTQSSGTGGKVSTGGAPQEAGVPEASVAVPDASAPDASVPDASVPDASGSIPALYCPNLPVGRVDGGPADAGTVPQWKDWALSTCGTCPAPSITCEDLVHAPSTYDPTTRQFVIQLAPSIAEIRSATLDFNFDAQLPGGGESSGYADGVILTIDHNTLTADLSGVVPQGVIDISSTDLYITDACGTESEVTRDYDGESGLSWSAITPDDGAAPFFSVQCER
ncbi:MAG: hypothetical protein ACRD16_08170 [Thermoanaerobaculia bacterium]